MVADVAGDIVDGNRAKLDTPAIKTGIPDLALERGDTLRSGRPVHQQVDLGMLAQRGIYGVAEGRAHSPAVADDGNAPVWHPGG